MTGNRVQGNYNVFTSEMNMNWILTGKEKLDYVQKKSTYVGVA